jgi:hypothetical protein
VLSSRSSGRAPARPLGEDVGSGSPGPAKTAGAPALGRAGRTWPTHTDLPEGVLRSPSQPMRSRWSELCRPLGPTVAETPPPGGLSQRDCGPPLQELGVPPP